MSGVVAQLAAGGERADPAFLERMARAVPERGPDGWGVWVGGSVALGHQLLRATPESLHERQPVSLPGRDLTGSWDGTLYNREDLARRLAAEERTRASQADLLQEPDSLLALRAYGSWGQAFLGDLVGDFAFVLWDGEKRQLLAAVDPVGMRPLYYHSGRHGLLLASDEMQLLVAPWVSRELDPTVVRSFLALALPCDGSAMFRGIRRLQGGHALAVREGTLKLWRYWDPRLPAGELRRDGDYVARFRELLRQAVVSRLRAIGPVASYLSGGMDSGSITATAGDHLSRCGPSPSADPPPFLCITSAPIGFNDTDSPGARAVSGHYGLPHCFVPVRNEGIIRTAIGRLERQATPYLMPDAADGDKMGEACREAGSRVCLLGYGAEEILDSARVLVRLFREFRWLSWLREFRAAYAVEGRSLLGAIMRWPLVAAPARLKRLGQGWRGDVWRLLGQPSRTEPRDATWDLFRRPDYELDEPLRWSRDRETGEGLHAENLAWFNRRYLRWGLEVRLPFLDRRLIEFMLTVPDRLLLRDGFTKTILREATAGILPDEVRLAGPLAGPTGFVSSALRGEERAALVDLFGGDLASRPFLRQEVARRLLRELLRGERSLRTPLWQMISLELWLRHFRAPGEGARPPCSGFRLDTQGACVQDGAVSR